MRMLYKFLLFSILPCCAICTAALCDCTNLGSNHQCCAGKYWNNTACTTCPSGYYCPGSGIAYCCPEPFSYSGPQSMNINQCEAHIQCGSNNVAVACDNWNDNKCVPNNNTPYYDVQWTYAGADGINNDTVWMHKQNHDWFAEPLMVWDIPENYHLETKPIYTNSGATQGWYETSFEIACVPNTKTCKSFNEPGNFPPIDCTTYNSTDCPSAQGCGLVYAGQGSGTTPVYRCTYLNNIGASVEQTNCAHENITGNAHWVARDDENNTFGFGYWDVSACKCGFNNQLNDSMHCYGNGSYPIMENAPISIVHSVGEHIIFNPEAHSSDFVCTKCQAGPYYVPGNDNVVTVTGCEPVPSYGSWRKPKHNGYCNDDNNNGTTWTYPLDGNPCPLKPCPAGKTTTEYGPIGSASCHYTNQTKFCDANGCFNITDAADGGWNWDY